jgi:hypothetical protein
MVLCVAILSFSVPCDAQTKRARIDLRNQTKCFFGSCDTQIEGARIGGDKADSMRLMEHEPPEEYAFINLPKLNNIERMKNEDPKYYAENMDIISYYKRQVPEFGKALNRAIPSIADRVKFDLQKDFKLVDDNLCGVVCVRKIVFDKRAIRIDKNFGFYNVISHVYYFPVIGSLALNKDFINKPMPVLGIQNLRVACEKEESVPVKDAIMVKYSNPPRIESPARYVEKIQIPGVLFSDGKIQGKSTDGRLDLVSMINAFAFGGDAEKFEKAFANAMCKYTYLEKGFKEQEQAALAQEEKERRDHQAYVDTFRRNIKRGDTVEVRDGYKYSCGGMVVKIDPPLAEVEETWVRDDGSRYTNRRTRRISDLYPCQ